MYNSSRSSKNNWALFLFVLAGITIGGLIGKLTSGIPYLEWLNYGFSFGLDSPVNIDLMVVKLLFQITFDITIASIVGIALSIVAYKLV